MRESKAKGIAKPLENSHPLMQATVLYILYMHETKHNTIGQIVIVYEDRHRSFMQSSPISPGDLKQGGNRTCIYPAFTKNLCLKR